jgi:RNA polymerase sigma-70 factor (ECF subfamily)
LGLAGAGRTLVGVAPTRKPQIPAGEITSLLRAWAEGDEAARDRLVPVVYAELRLREQNAAWENRAHFLAVASRLMRRILVDHARARAAAKRGGGFRVTLAEGLAAAAEPEMLDLDAALDELAALDEDQARLVELRFFGGLSIEETAGMLGLSTATVSREWATAKSWLYRRLNAGPSSKAPGASAE